MNSLNAWTDVKSVHFIIQYMPKVSKFQSAEHTLIDMSKLVLIILGIIVVFIGVAILFELVKALIGVVIVVSIIIIVVGGAFLILRQIFRG